MTEKHLNELVEACRKQNRAAQKTVYEHYYSVVFGVCLRYSSGREEAKELANDAFLKAFMRLENYAAGGNFGGWLYRIAIRTAIDRYRSSVSKPDRRFLSEDAMPVPSENLENRLLDRIDAAEKLQLVQRLSPAYRAVFNLFVVEEMTHEEIADALQISIGASKSNLSKARQQLQNVLEKHLAS